MIVHITGPLKLSSTPVQKNKGELKFNVCQTAFSDGCGYPEGPEIRNGHHHHYNNEDI